MFGKLQTCDRTTYIYIYILRLKFDFTFLISINLNPIYDKNFCIEIYEYVNPFFLFSFLLSIFRFPPLSNVNSYSTIPEYEEDQSSKSFYPSTHVYPTKYTHDTYSRNSIIGSKKHSNREPEESNKPTPTPFAPLPI